MLKLREVNAIFLQRLTFTIFTVIIYIMKKIIRIIARLNVGGPAIHVILLTTSLDRNRFVSLLVSGVESPGEGNMLALADTKGVAPVIYPRLGRELNLFGDIITLWSLYRLFRREKPDIVHTHTAKAGAVGRLAAWLAGVPVIVHTFHGHVLNGYFGSIKTGFFRWLERFLAKRTNAIIAVSEQCRNDLINYRISRPDHIRFIPLGLELNRFRQRDEAIRKSIRQEWGIPLEAFTVGVIARLVPIKRHVDLFHAIPTVLERYPDAYFAIVGDGELRTELDALAKNLKIENRIVFTGFRVDQPSVYQALDLTALTSANEGLPVSIIESLASGTPVVATRVGGVPELIQDGVNGYLAEPGNPESIAQALLKAISNPEHTSVLGRKAQDETIKKYSIERLVGDMESLYDELCAEKVDAGK